MIHFESAHFCVSYNLKFFWLISCASIDGTRKTCASPTKARKPSICCVSNAWSFAAWCWATADTTRRSRRTSSVLIVLLWFEQQRAAECPPIICCATTATWYSIDLVCRAYMKRMCHDHTRERAHGFTLFGWINWDRWPLNMPQRGRCKSCPACFDFSLQLTCENGNYWKKKILSNMKKKKNVHFLFVQCISFVFIQHNKLKEICVLSVISNFCEKKLKCFSRVVDSIWLFLNLLASFKHHNISLCILDLLGCFVW